MNKIALRNQIAKEYNQLKETRGGSNKWDRPNVAKLLSKKYGVSVRTILRYAKLEKDNVYKRHSVWTYLLESQILNSTTIYKIGKTCQMGKRLPNLNRNTFGFPIKLNTIVKGDYEAEFHHRFADNRINNNREWFTFTPDELLEVFMAFSEPRLDFEVQTNEHKPYVNPTENHTYPHNTIFHLL